MRAGGLAYSPLQPPTLPVLHLGKVFTQGRGRSRRQPLTHQLRQDAQGLTGTRTGCRRDGASARNLPALGSVLAPFFSAPRVSACTISGYGQEWGEWGVLHGSRWVLWAAHMGRGGERSATMDQTATVNFKLKMTLEM